MVKAKTAPADDRIITVDELLERIPLSYPTIWSMYRRGEFPKPIQLSPARIGWRLSAVQAWIEDRERHPVDVAHYGWRKNRTGAR